MASPRRGESLRGEDERIDALETKGGFGGSSWACMLVRMCRVDVAAEYPELAEIIEDARRDWLALGARGQMRCRGTTNQTEKTYVRSI